MSWRVLLIVAQLAIGLGLTAQSHTELMSQAQALLKQNTPESLRSALEIFEKSRQQSAASGNNKEQIEALFGTVNAYFLLHETEKELAPLEQVRVLAHASGDLDSEGQALFTLAVCYRALKDTPHSLKEFEEAAAVYRAAHRDMLLGRVLSATGQIYQVRPGGQDREKAIEYFTEAATLQERTGDSFNLGLTWWSLGNTYDSLNRSSEARDAFSKAAPLVSQNSEIEGRVLASLGSDEKSLKHYAEAIKALEGALVLKGSNAHAERYLALMNLGICHEELGQSAEAAAAYQRASAEAETAGNWNEAGTAQMRLSRLRGAAPHEWQAATEADFKALDFFTRAGNRESQGTMLSSIASHYARLGDYRKSLEYDLKALPLMQGESMRFPRAVTLYTIGDAYNALHESKEALDYLNQALETYEPGAEGRAGVLASIGEVYNDMGEHRTALEKYDQALEIAKKTGNPASENKILNDIALAKEWLTGKTEAEGILKALLESAQKRKDVQQEAATTNNLGELARFYGNFEEAEKLYARALELNGQIGDQYSEAKYSTGLAATYAALGEGSKALETLNHALDITKKLNDPAGEAKVLADLARLYVDEGEYQRSLETLNQAQALVNSDNDPETEAGLLGTRASMYVSLGAFDLAKDYYSRALEIHKRLVDRFNQGVMLNNLAVLAQRSGDRAEALRDYKAALIIAEETGNKLGQSRLLSSESVLLADMGKTQEALTNLDQALKLAQEIKDIDSEALAIHNRAGLREKQGDLAGAMADYDKALELWRKINALPEQATSQFVKARLEGMQGHLEQGLLDIREAIRLANTTRGQAATADLRASLSSTSSHFAELEVDLLMRLNAAHPGQGFDAQAFEASERGRARSLIEMLREGRLDVTQQVDPELRQQEQAIQSSINAKAGQQMKLANSPEAAAEIQKLEAEIQDLRVKYDNVQAQIREKNPAYGALTEPQPITLKQIQRGVLDHDTLLLEYALGEERSYVWAVGMNSLHDFQLGKRSEIEAAADEFDDLISGHKNNPEALKQAGAELRAKLLAPVASELTTKRLAIVADGGLQRLPFGLVPDPNSATAEPLLASHEVVTEPSASVVDLERRLLAKRKRAPKQLAVIADPVFQPDDARLQKPAETDAKVAAPVWAAVRGAAFGEAEIERLPYTADEAKRILSYADSKDALLLSGLQASKAQIQGAELARYQIVHFATHGLLDTEHPELSGLVLSLYDKQGKQIDGFLRLNEIYNMKLPAELVVLSACESGGGKLLMGEGVVGLTRGFLYAGTRTLAVSLWSVNDASTSELMARFYAAMMKGKHLRPAAALREAQLSMRSDAQWSDPYYWAAFTVQGEWR